MANIDITNITDATTVSNGTGVFDKLIQAVEKHIDNQYKEGRLVGTDYANVYLGSMQSVLSESIKFLLQEQQADKQADLLSSQIINQDSKTNMERNLTEAKLEQELGYNVTRDVDGSLILGALNSTGEIDKKKKLLDDQDSEVLARTIREDSMSTSKISTDTESISSSQSRTAREDTSSSIENSLIVEKIESENKSNEVGGLIDLQKNKLTEDISSSQARTAREDSMSTSKISTDSEQITASQARTIREDTSSSIENSLIVEKTESENKNNEINGLIDLQKNKLTEDIASSQAETTRSNDMSVSKIAVDSEQITASSSRTTREDTMNTKKELLVQAQTLGFASDTKQKVLKQMFENYAVNLSIAGVGDVPEAGQDKAIDHLVADILNSVGVTNIVDSGTVSDLNVNVIPPPA